MASTVGTKKPGDKRTTKTTAAVAPSGVDVRAMRRVMIERWDAKQAEAKRRWAAAATTVKTATRVAATATTTASAGEEKKSASDGAVDANAETPRRNPEVDPPDTTLEWRLDGRGGARGERPGVSLTARYAWILRYRTITHRAYDPSRDDGSAAPPQRIGDDAAAAAAAKTMRLHMLEWAREWPTEVPAAMLAAMTKMETASAKRKVRSDASDGDDDSGENGNGKEAGEEGAIGKRRRRRAKFGKRRRLSRETARERRGADGDSDDDCCSSDSGAEDGLVSEEAFERAEKREREHEGGGDDDEDDDAKLENQIDPDVLDLVQRQPRLETDAIDPPRSCGSLIPFADAVFADELAWRLAAFGHMCRLDAYIRETTKAGYTYHIGLYDVTRTSTEDDDGGGDEFGGAAESASAPLAADSNDRVAV